MSSVVKVPDHPRVGVRPVGMVADADALDNGVNLDCVNAADTVPQRMRDVVTGPCADDQFILEWRAASRSSEKVNQRIG